MNETSFELKVKFIRLTEIQTRKEIKTENSIILKSKPNRNRETQSGINIFL